MKTYRCQLEVRGYELDSFGHVNHGVYLNYFEHARWKMLAEEGITLELITRDKRWPVIAQIEVRYLKPTFMGDQLEIQTRVIEQSRARFTLEQMIYRDGVLVTSATVKSVVVNENGRPVEMTEPYSRLWSE
ncbi:MAG: thioesterase family protein [Oligoflexia bacterium]|nr:thioesterase family protein [Oligoflexia bacterium]